jgi:hypothetical protein
MFSATHWAVENIQTPFLAKAIPISGLPLAP